MVRDLVDSYQNDEIHLQNKALRAIRRAFLSLIGKAIGKRALQKYLNPNLWNLESRTIDYYSSDKSVGSDSAHSLTDSDFSEVLVTEGVMDEKEVRESKMQQRAKDKSYKSMKVKNASPQMKNVQMGITLKDPERKQHLVLAKEGRTLRFYN